MYVCKKHFSMQLNWCWLKREAEFEMFSQTHYKSQLWHALSAFSLPTDFTGVIAANLAAAFFCAGKIKFQSNAQVQHAPSSAANCIHSLRSTNQLRTCIVWLEWLCDIFYGKALRSTLTRLPGSTSVLMSTRVSHRKIKSNTKGLLQTWHPPF